MFDEQADERLAQSVDVHGAAAGEMLDPPVGLGRARDVLAAHRHLLLHAHDRAAARGARFGHAERLRILRPFFQDHGRDLGNHVPAFFDDDRVALADVLSADFLLVVQGRPADRGPGEEHGLKLGHRRDRAGAAHLEVDFPQHASRPGAA